MLEQVGERRNKLSTLVRFPLTGLDMAPHVVKRSQSMRNLNLGGWKQHHQPADMILPHDYLYDLYAVCNHHGGMHGGHYTGKERQCKLSQSVFSETNSLSSSHNLKKHTSATFEREGNVRSNIQSQLNGSSAG